MTIKSGTVIPGILDKGEWAACFGLSWAEMLLRDQAVSNRIIREGGQYLRKVCGTMGVAAGRNDIVHNFLVDSDAEWLLFIDTDMGFSPDTPDRLIASAEANDADVLGALCFAQKADTDRADAHFHGQHFRIIPTLYEFVEVKETGEQGFRHINKYRRESFQTVAATGAACMLIRRSALEAMPADPFQPITLSGAGGKGQPRTFSEDLSFCIRAASAGLVVGVDTSIKTTHYKGGIYLDEVAFAMQQETLIQAKGHEIARMAEWAARRAEGPFGNVNQGLNHAGSDRWTGGDKKAAS